MPVIGKLRTSGGRVDTRVTSGRVDTRAAGAVSGALAKLGGGAAEATTKVSQVLHREEVLNYNDASKMEFDNFAIAEKERLKKQYAGTDHKGYIEDLKLSLDFERERLLEGAPSRDANDYFKRSSQGSYDRAMAEGNKYSLQESLNFSSALDDKISANLGQNAFNNPDAKTVSDELLSRIQTISSHEGNRYNNAQTTKKIKEAISHSRNGLLGGLEASGRNSEGLAILKSLIIP